MEITYMDDLDYESVFQEAPPYRQYPYRSPLILAEVVKDIIQDKVFCDLGCGEGDIMAAMARYAKRVIGIEYSDRGLAAKKRNLTVTKANLRECDLPDADVYFTWITREMDLFLVQKILETKPQACTILNISRKGGHVGKIAEKWGGTIREFPCGEKKCAVTKFDFSIDDTWWVCVTRKDEDSSADI